MKVSLAAGAALVYLRRMQLVHRRSGDARAFDTERGGVIRHVTPRAPSSHRVRHDRLEPKRTAR